jgi:hypothetical protein
MIGAIFNSANGRVPVLVTGKRKSGLLEVYAIKHRPFTEYGSFPPQSHAVKRGYVRKEELSELRSTRIGG